MWHTLSALIEFCVCENPLKFFIMPHKKSYQEYFRDYYFIEAWKIKNKGKSQHINYKWYFKNSLTLKNAQKNIEVVTSDNEAPQTGVFKNDWIILWVLTP